MRIHEVQIKILENHLQNLYNLRKYKFNKKDAHSVMALVRCERSGSTGSPLKNVKKWPPLTKYCSFSLY